MTMDQQETQSQPQVTQPQEPQVGAEVAGQAQQEAGRSDVGMDRPRRGPGGGQGGPGGGGRGGRGGGGRGGRGGDDEDTGGVDHTTVGVFRTASTVKGGRRFQFGALVVAGDRRGNVGIGYAKGREVPQATEKAEKEARRSLKRIAVLQGTIPHTVMGRFGASMVRLIPASPGTGVVAGGAVRAVLELCGIRDCLTKAYGSTNQKNLVKATMRGLESLRNKQKIEELRGVSVEDTHVDDFLKRGPAFVQAEVRRPKPRQIGGEGRGGPGGGGGRRGGGGSGGGGRRGRGPAQESGGSDAGAPAME